MAAGSQKATATGDGVITVADDLVAKAQKSPVLDTGTKDGILDNQVNAHCPGQRPIGFALIASLPLAEIPQAAGYSESWKLQQSTSNVGTEPPQSLTAAKHRGSPTQASGRNISTCQVAELGMRGLPAAAATA